MNFAGMQVLSGVWIKMVIRTNVTALRTLGESRKQQTAVAKTLEKLSSGFRINRAADDAAGLGVSESMRAQITELERCQQNVNEGLDVTNTADGALEEINNMLRRAHELCIQAANGIYDDSDRDAISMEMNELFDEIDRITAGTRHNDIHLFRYTGPEMPKEIHYEYDETFTEVDPVSRADWGQMDFVQDALFDRPQDAKAPTATMKLDSSIDINNARTLNGKSVTVNGRRFDFSSSDPADEKFEFPYDYYAVKVSVSAGQTVQQALQSIVTYANYYPPTKVDKVEVDAATKSVTFTGVIEDYDYDVAVDGGNTPYESEKGDGAAHNGLVISSTDANSLGQVDGSAATNNKPVYGSNGKLEMTIPDRTFSASDIANLNRNTLVVDGKAIPISTLGITTATTRDELGQKLAAAINSLSVCTASYDAATKKMTVTASDLGTAPISRYIYEQTAGSSGNEYIYDYKNKSSSSLGISAARTSTAGPESYDAYEVTVPAAGGVPFSFYVNGTSYCFYEAGTWPPAGYTDNTSSSIVKVPIAAGANVQETVLNTIKSKLSSSNSSARVTCEIVGGKIKITSGVKNKPLNVSVSGSTAGLSAYKREPNPAYVPGSRQVLGIGTTYFMRDVSVSMALPKAADGTLDIDKLAGTGFSVNGKSFEFVNNTPGVRSDYTDINLAGLTTFAEVQAAIQNCLDPSAAHAAYTVDADPSDPSKLKIKFRVAANGSAVSVKDGYHDLDGVFTNPGDGTKTGVLSGGTMVEHAKKEIDFSTINESNLDTLLGKGFRITCATCTGEYINVFFCWENDGRVPESFEIEDPDTNEIRTIHNVAVELSKVNSGGSIVQDIVAQVKPTLQHYTDVEVGNPPTTLVCLDKRVGDIYDPPGSGNLKQASVMSGLSTNFTYSVVKREVEDNPPVKTSSDQVTVDYRMMYIYAGSHPEAQFIPIHLPYLDLETLNLRPPWVDMKAQDPSQWLRRVDEANNAISTSRGRLGADHNRLEHAENVLIATAENVTASESRIRDADMAKMMEEQVKLSILGQAQMSMLAQASMEPQKVLELLK